MELENAVTAPAADVPEALKDGVTGQEAKVDDGADKTIGKPADQQEVIDWAKDKRYETMWKKDPNQLYKSYINTEKGFVPMKKQLDELNAIFAEYKLKPEQIKDVMAELNTLKAPEHPSNQLVSFIQDYAKDPVYAKKIEVFFDELEKSRVMAKYPGYTDEQIRKELERDERFNALEGELNEYKMNALTQEYNKNITAELGKIDALCKERNFVFTPEIKQAFIDECIKDNLDPKYMFISFANKHKADLDKNYESVIEARVLERLKKNKGTTVPEAKIGQPPVVKGTFREKLNSALGMTQQ